MCCHFHAHDRILPCDPCVRCKTKVNGTKSDKRYTPLYFYASDMSIHSRKTPDGVSVAILMPALASVGVFNVLFDETQVSYFHMIISHYAASTQVYSRTLRSSFDVRLCFGLGLHLVL